MSSEKFRYTSPRHPQSKPLFDETGIVSRLKKPAGPVDVVFDSDTYNEVDDQYALVYMLRSEKLRVKALYAAPFSNARAETPAEGMEKSFGEIKNVLSLIAREDLMNIAYRGSKTYLPDETTPVASDAAKDLAERAMGYTPENPLYVVAIGAITNIASALLLKPEIRDRIVVVWLGGHALEWPDTYEFNLYQDIAAGRVLFGCGVAVVLLPCRGVVSEFAASKPELEYWLKGKNELCDYLLKETVDYSDAKYGGIPTWSKPIWDVAAVAWLLDDDFMYDRLEPSPIPGYDHQWAFDRTRHPIRYVYSIDRAKLFHDLFGKLATYSQ